MNPRIKTSNQKILSDLQAAKSTKVEKPSTEYTQPNVKSSEQVKLCDVAKPDSVANGQSITIMMAPLYERYKEYPITLSCPSHASLTIADLKQAIINDKNALVKVFSGFGMRWNHVITGGNIPDSLLPKNKNDLRIFLDGELFSDDRLLSKELLASLDNTNVWANGMYLGAACTFVARPSADLAKFFAEFLEKMEYKKTIEFNESLKYGDALPADMIAKGLSSHSACPDQDDSHKNAYKVGM